MTAKGGFTSAGQLGPNRAEGAHQHLPILAASSDAARPAHQSEPSPSSAALVNPDLHRQSHSSSKLPAFRFTDRRASSGNTASKADTPLSITITTAQRNHSRIPSQDLKNNNNNNNTTTTTTTSDGSHNLITDASTDTSTSASLAPATSQNTSAALPLQPSLALHAPSPPVSPNPGSSVAPASVSHPVPGALPSTASADPGPLAPPSTSASGPVAAPGIFSAPATAPATTHSNLSHPTTHHHDEKHADTASVSASASATIIASVNTASPTELSPTDDVSPPLLRSRSRASSFQPSSDVSVVEPSPQAKRPASVPDAPAPVQGDTLSPHLSSNKNRTRRSLVSRRSTAAAASTGPPLSLNAERLHAIEAIEAAQGAHASYPSSSDGGSVKGSPSSGQRELILPKTLSKPSSIDERRSSLSQRPPVSYRPPLSNNTEPPASNPVRVPPIRAFRSSGSRKSLTLDMNSRPRYYDFGDDGPDSNHDQTLRALEGRADHEVLRSAPAFSSRHDAFDNDDTGDVFLKIAREEASRRQPDEQPADETRSVVSRSTRFSHRRPLSNVVPARQPSSPPQVRRRLSDQQETSRSRGYDDERASEVSRMSTYRSLTRDKAASVHPGEDLSRRSTIRPSPVTPRSIAFQEPGNDATSRRRPSVTDNSNSNSNSNGQTRSSTYKSALGHHNKTYNSSPLVRSFDFQRQPNQETSNGPEGTESTLSTTAPSTVWDELDDLKSRIHRLELTGKLPSTSGAAVSRLSDERPPTATTTVTTISSSPKRVTNGNQNADAVSTTSSHRESHPILHSALAKSKVLLDAEVYRALEAAANDAMALSSMMGTVGQPGPISSGASTIGSGTTVTDRQLRRKAEGVCRSLTELCLALGEEVTQTRPRQSVEAPPPVQNDAPTTPTINKTFTGFTHQRRPSLSNTEQALARANTSPRAMSKFEERRLNILNGNSLPASRVSNSTPSTPLEPISQRRSSLLVARSRRAGTEEPEDGRKSSLLLRTRRAGTEEPDEGRRTSLFVRGRRGTVGDESEDEMKFRSPSRAHTELNAIRTVTHDATPQQQASDTTSAIPRRRFASSNLTVSRLATPATSMATPPRRYLERSTQQDHNNNNNNTVADKLAEDRGQRYMSMGQTTLINRTGSMIRRPNRDSIVASANPSTAAGGYR
ncbi:uncharacterized protein NECHADRAFT_92815 [Fusarium vanettenii 77-13-4]|uniref:LPXTG-motif cell wall anchor domain protein n=1 Tax=Fusarium vanettenii (strain ATCC MYA-4622 / CBS 123669 / FGSC 9596 / NRRL 45880 / 77-13-4) TaxID=660122 RepID=C7YQS4_FUSV7|nr:uncharacterized protein NECHADRAFT_92815 [Fusarium vanettenii 77-13-4]EEU46522.1 hypothetical protein NECHADRAFT_92815 [Fusarium vanettenii 77-13-4]